jgi:hypothetical protein
LYTVQDYGLATDRAVLSFLDSYYRNGTIYSSTSIGYLPTAPPDWVWLPGGLNESSILQDPQWLIAPLSSVSLYRNAATEQLLVNNSLVLIGSYLIVNRQNYSLSSLLYLKAAH